MSFTDQRAHAVGRLQSLGSSPRSNRISSTWSAGRRSSRKTGPTGLSAEPAPDVIVVAPPLHRNHISRGYVGKVQLRYSTPEESAMAFTLPPLPYDYKALE